MSYFSDADGNRNASNWDNDNIWDLDPEDKFVGELDNLDTDDREELIEIASLNVRIRNSVLNRGNEFLDKVWLIGPLSSTIQS